jgi:hypothetical protein
VGFFDSRGEETDNAKLTTKVELKLGANPRRGKAVASHRGHRDEFGFLLCILGPECAVIAQDLRWYFHGFNILMVRDFPDCHDTRPLNSKARK